MPYILSGLVDGQRPANVRYVGEGTTPGAGEVLLSDVQWERMPLDWVWDAAGGRMRAPTAAETLALAKARKDTELRDTADREITSSTRASEREIVIYKAATGATLNTEEQQIRTNMTNNYNRLKSLLVTLRDPQTNTVEKVNAIVW